MGYYLTEIAPAAGIAVSRKQAKAPGMRLLAPARLRA
jgi:hypothetical protein